MKLAFCLYRFFPFGGLERDFLRISRICADRGHSIHVFTMSWEGPIPDDYHVTIIPVKHRTNHGRNEMFFQKLKGLLAQETYDVIIGFNKMPGLDLYYAADSCYVDKIQQTKSSLFKLTGRYRHFAKFEKAVFGASSKTELMMISEIEQTKFTTHYHTQPERFHLLPPGISTDRKKPPNADIVRQDWRTEFNIKDDEKVILMIGSDFKRKGLDRVLLGLASLPDKLREKTHIMVLGKDNPDPFISMAKKLGVARQLNIFLGRDDVPRFLLGADLFAHPAYSENTGTVILEAIVAGLPVLITEACGYAFHVERSKAGLITKNPYSQENFNAQLEQMLTSSEYQTWAENCIEYSLTEDLYSMPETAANLIDSVGKKRIASR